MHSTSQRRRYRGTWLSAAMFALLSLSVIQARAEIERTGYPTDHGIELIWWPKVTPPAGWIHDDKVSLANAINMMVPRNETFVDSPVLMYARAFYHEAGDTGRHLATAIDEDKKGFLGKYPKSKIEEVAATETGDGTKLRTLAFIPDGAGNWDLVAYGREPEYVLMFCISARTPAALAEHRAAFEAMVRSYTSKD